MNKNKNNNNNNRVPNNTNDHGDLELFLKEHSVLHTLQFFKKENIDLKLLKKMNNDQLKELGLTLTDRIEIMNAINPISNGKYLLFYFNYFFNQNYNFNISKFDLHIKI